MAISLSNNHNHPKKIGIIMDGNGRWAKSNKLKINKGHEKGVGVVRDIVKECIACLLYTSPSPRDKRQSRMPSSA